MSLVDTMLNLPFSVLNHWGYAIILFITLIEATPILGFFVPGQLIVILAGFLVKQSMLDMGNVILVASFGAIFGDLIGYMLGKKYGISFITKYGKYFFFKREHYEKTKMIMNNHTGKALIFGRLNSLTRSFAPFVAGSSNLPFRKFMVYNIIGGISWAVAFVMVGYIFGASYEIASKYIGRFMLLAIVLSIALIYAYSFINKKRHIFTKYHLYTLVLSIFSLYVFSKMTEDVLDNEFMTRVDVWLNAHVILLWSPLLNKVMLFITNIANSIVLLILCIILFSILVYKKKWYHSILLVFSIIGGVSLELLAKLIIHRTRPQNSLIEFSGYSFPSGHATMAIIFFSVLLYSFKDDIKNVLYRRIFITTNIALFFLIGLSRVYLNAHWFSDVIAGFALGMFWLTLLILIINVTILLSKRTTQKEQVSNKE